jgi:anti-anti-sigma regulatory factor
MALADGVLFAPIVGHLDSRRSQAITVRLLQQAHVQRARLVVLDVEGVPAMDTAVAQALLQAAQALRLLGCDVTLSGVTSTVAATLVELGVSLAGITTVRSPQEALAQHMRATRGT